jgi:hypothetical protein
MISGRLNDFVEPIQQPLVRDRQLGANASQFRTGRVKHLTPLINATRNFVDQAWTLLDATDDVGQTRALIAQPRDIPL